MGSGEESTAVLSSMLKCCLFSSRDSSWLFLFFSISLSFLYSLIRCFSSLSSALLSSVFSIQVKSLKNEGKFCKFLDPADLRELELNDIPFLFFFFLGTPFELADSLCSLPALDEGSDSSYIASSPSSMGTSLFVLDDAWLLASSLCISTVSLLPAGFISRTSTLC